MIFILIFVENCLIICINYFSVWPKTGYNPAYINTEKMILELNFQVTGQKNYIKVGILESIGQYKISKSIHPAVSEILCFSRTDIL